MYPDLEGVLESKYQLFIILYVFEFDFVLSLHWLFGYSFDWPHCSLYN